ncbi:MAG TPA: M20/M25/M40 family metallo-hydrolase, partial [Prolixibacteraceae bacterium]|nr:M20/M25/M40 family metallo-hydrolase [Prolixibacteraceae bacterium]
SACTVQYQPKITEKELYTNISILASDQFQGRKPGLPGDSLAADFIAGKFKKSGIKMLYNKGFQPVKLITGFKFGTENHLSSANQTFSLSADYEPLFFSANKAFTGKMAFAGYGITVSTDSLKWDDYQNLQAENQWVLIFDGVPAHLQQSTEIKKYSDIRSKVLNAIDHHAGGILIVTPDFDTKGAARTVMFDKNSSPYSVPVMKISQKTADLILNNQFTFSDLENTIKTGKKPFFRPTGITVKGEASVLPKITMTQNIVGMVPGTDPKLSEEYIIVGAHYDHLGLGGPGSGSRMPDSAAVHYGADDNASGVAAIIELAEKFSHEKNNRRPILFVAFTAEEFGLIGSRAFVAEPPFSLKKADAMFNFDMVGRLDSAKELTIGGVGTAIESNALIDSLVHGFKIKISKEGYGPSDHASFYGENIPVIYFTTGVHDQYHTPNDTYNRINVQGEQQIVENAYVLIREVANRSKKLTYQESGPKTGASGRTDLKVTLGIIPDFAGTGKDGMRIDGVTPGKPAAKAGLQKGDVIIAIDGKKVGSIYDYMARMKAYSPGQIISVDVMRGTEKKVFLVTL